MEILYSLSSSHFDSILLDQFDGCVMLPPPFCRPVLAFEDRAAGELLRDGDDTYQWNAAGRLTRATVEGVTSRFAYLGDGSRISMTVGSETITYTLDVAAPLVQVLVANEDGTGTTYLYGIARIGEDDGGWQYYLADHLGSVRSLVDAEGSVAGTRAYEPYGVVLESAGAAESVYGFTGEQTDPSGLVYLRARMYAPGLELFLSEDPWGGNIRLPSSLNGWSYVEANPIRFVDRTGHFPTEEDVQSGSAEFTCNCGWIDWNHAIKSDELSFALLDDLKYAADNSLLLPGNWGIYFGIPLGAAGIEVDLFRKSAVIPNSSVSGSTNRMRVAVSIFMDANEHFEELQGYWDWLPVFGQRLRSSYFSEEDLPSDIIGFYIASQRFSGTGLESEQIIQQIRDVCGAVGTEKSLTVFREDYKDGTRETTGWRNWFPSFLPQVGCDQCDEPRAWPSEFAGLAALRVLPQVNGTWWWYRGILEDGPPVRTERHRVVVFADPEDLRPPVPPPYEAPPLGGTRVP
jgi:RHS repeat-associated protein